MFFDIEKNVDQGILSDALRISENDETTAEVTSVSGGRGLLAIGDSVGRLHLLHRHMNNAKVIDVFSGERIQMIARSTKSGE